MDAANVGKLTLKRFDGLMLMLSYTDRYFQKVALIVIDNGMSNNNKANQ